MYSRAVIRKLTDIVTFFFNNLIESSELFCLQFKYFWGIFKLTKFSSYKIKYLLIFISLRLLES